MGKEIENDDILNIFKKGQYIGKYIRTEILRSLLCKFTVEEIKAMASEHARNIERLKDEKEQLKDRPLCALIQELGK